MVFGQVQVSQNRTLLKNVYSVATFLYYSTILITLLYVDRFRRCYRPRKTVQHQTCNENTKNTSV